MVIKFRENPDHALMIAKKSNRYRNFTYCDKPGDKLVPFDKFMAGEDIDIVQLHLLDVIGIDENKDIVGFCGAFEWKNNTLAPLDGDSYNPGVLVYGYRWFTTEDGKRGLDILVGDDW